MKHPILAAVVALGVTFYSSSLFQGRVDVGIKIPKSLVSSAPAVGLRVGIGRQLQRVAASYHNQREHAEILRNIERALEERDEEIDDLAEEFYAEHHCTDGWGEDLDRQGLLDFIAVHTRYIEKELHLAESGASLFLDRHFDNVEIGRYLDRIRAGQFSLDDPPSVPQMLAAARSYEWCLSERGVVDIYRDLQRQVESGNCSEAEYLAAFMGDKRSSWGVVKTCISPEQDSPELAADRFYDRLEDALDEDLAIAAQFVEVEEYDRYHHACTHAREVEGQERNEAHACCAADFAYSRISPDDAFLVPSVTPEMLDELAADLPLLQQKRVCILQTAAARLREQQGIPQTPDGGVFSAEDYFRRCMGEL